jgi:hypothetical protein
MARAKIIQQWADGSATLLMVSTTADGPDALDECVTRIAALWHVCLADTVPDTIEDAGS